MLRAASTLVLLIAAGCLAADRERAGDGRLPNVVLILAAGVGYGAAGCYVAGSRIPSPHIERLAR